MAGVRIRWRGVAKVAAIALVGLLAARLLPSLLRAPEPPPLGADVGLPKVAPVGDVPRGEEGQPVADAPRHPVKASPESARSHERRWRLRQRRSRPRPARDAPASKAVIGSKHRHRVDPEPASRHQKENEAKPPSHRRKENEAPPPPAPEYSPPVTPEPVPERLPEPSPPPSSTPGDGSQEFAPH